MAVTGWIVDKSVAARSHVPGIRTELRSFEGALHVCPLGELEQRYSARSVDDYDRVADEIRQSFRRADPPPDIFERALRLQHDLAHHHGMWHRTPIADLLIAETALHHSLGILHVDRDFDRIAEVRPLVVRRLKVS